MKALGLIILLMFCISCNTKIKQNYENQFIENRIENISEEYISIKELSIKYLKFGATRNEENTIKIYNQKWEAPLKFAITLFYKSPKDYIEKFETLNDSKIPTVYSKFLQEINGCSFFEFDLFGLTPSIYRSGLLDRSKTQCFDLGTANRNWKLEYRLNEDLFYFGSRAYSFNENIGYFMDNDGAIKSIRKNGQVMNEWTSFSSFLKTELQIAEKMMIKDLPEEEKGKIK